MLVFVRCSTLSGLEQVHLRRAGINPNRVIGAEWRFYVETDCSLSGHELDILRWLLCETFEPKGLTSESGIGHNGYGLEIGPRLNFATAWGTTARQICLEAGLKSVVRIERSRRLVFVEPLSARLQAAIIEQLSDRMTEMHYPEPLTSFDTNLQPEPVFEVRLLEEGPQVLHAANRQYGLAMDEQDIKRFAELFRGLGRNPTNVELFQYGQGNSEHCRHGFFRGLHVIDGVSQTESLMDIVQIPHRELLGDGTAVVAFHDDSSAIWGGEVSVIQAQRPGQPSPLVVVRRLLHSTCTAETHNHPTLVAPYPGAATGTGGRMRDNMCVGRGGWLGVGGTGFCVGNLHIPGYPLPWEDDGYVYSNYSSPLDQLIQGSNGTSHYGNCVGEPTVFGFARTFGLYTPDGYRAWSKPVLYTVGVGQIDYANVEAEKPSTDMVVVLVGGPSYRIGMGGGSVSSMMSGEAGKNLAFDSVQRGDPAMAQRLYRVFQACGELGEDNPICSAHDLGAGGNSNALAELAYPAGGQVNVVNLPVGDTTMSLLEVWGNEAQERNAVLVRRDNVAFFLELCFREGCPAKVVGRITGDGQFTLVDRDGSKPVDLPLEPLLGKVEPKVSQLTTVPLRLKPLRLPPELTVYQALERVLRLVSVGSKRWLTNKADRSVTGRVARQPGVGPFDTPLSNFAVMANSLITEDGGPLSGTAMSLGERPLLGPISPAAQGYMTVAEALLNLAGAYMKGFGGIRCSANWMWAAKQPGEGVGLRQAASAMRDLMLMLGIAIDGGKDSLSMAVVGPDGVVKAPGQLVVAPYAVMPDVTLHVTPEFKAPGNHLIFIDLSCGNVRLGGSALAQAYQQVGDECPDVEDVIAFKQAFEALQELVARRLIVSLHDRSDGGLITTLLEMGFAGGYGFTVSVYDTLSDPLAAMFSEELGVVIETDQDEAVETLLENYGVPYQFIGRVGQREGPVRVEYNGAVVLDESLVHLRRMWEDTSLHLELEQTDPGCVDSERAVLDWQRWVPSWGLSFDPTPTPAAHLREGNQPKVAILRGEGTNGDRELAASFMAAGFEPWDVSITDLLDRKITLDPFQGIAFPGGFAYGDVLDAGKGMAGIIRFSSLLTGQFEEFFRRPDTFSFGTCNGAQLMTLLGWVPLGRMPDAEQPRFVQNTSGRFESRFVTVKVMPSPAIMLRGMAGSVMGVWVAHGEGRLHVPGEGLDDLIAEQLTPLRYTGPDGPTEQYPYNPNGSPEGITALCSPDGRHLAMMPHPERLAMGMWQWQWTPPEWKHLTVSPWLRMFQNARTWCAGNQ